MKKTLSILLFSALLQADAFEDNVTSVIKKELGFDSRVVKKEILGSHLMYIEISPKNADTRASLLATDDGKIVLSTPKLIASTDDEAKNKVARNIDELKNIQDDKLASLFKSIPEKRYLNLKSKKSDADTIIIVADPFCPYCQKEINDLESTLERVNVKVLMAVVHKDKEAFVRSAMITRDFKKQPTQKDKIAYLKNMFNPKYKISNKDNNIDLSEVKDTTSKVFASPYINGTPFMYKLKK